MYSRRVAKYNLFWKLQTFFSWILRNKNKKWTIRVWDTNIKSVEHNSIYVTDMVVYGIFTLGVQTSVEPTVLLTNVFNQRDTL